MSVEVKICGITNIDDARIAFESGADYIGFIFYEKSPRSISVADAYSVMAGLEDTCRTVGVFVNEPPSFVESVARDINLYAVQMHGDESPEGFQEMSVPVWRALRVGGDVQVSADDGWNVDRYVIDSSVSGMYGGTGVKVDWDLAAKFAESRRIMLSGGLSPDNVAEAIEAVKPLGVDVASGVETEPGRKDHGKLREFVKKAKGMELE